eukprot:TRINITY_DN58914_c0_g1_i1.p1 TRINITY_DN58914_c0_g1~~TRINITY_DN58914_c0_g1_i1.p1  ORF type:complete len:250 (-),score=17.33 TRINITY_DN58914_c0_g1_i1:318-1043(-)
MYFALALLVFCYTQNIAHAATAYLNLLRHGEKDDFSGERLSWLGYERAEYYKRCMGPWNAPSEAFPFPLGNLMAQPSARVDDPVEGNYGLSHRSVETLEPLAAAMNTNIHTICRMTDVTCFLSEAFALLAENRTLVIAWEHKLLSLLFSKLAPIANGVKTFAHFPHTCDADSWMDPRFGSSHSSCFDLIWQIQYVAVPGIGWNATNVKSLHAGFGGSAYSPCAQGLAPIGLVHDTAITLFA